MRRHDYTIQHAWNPVAGAPPGRFLVGKWGWTWGIPGILSDSKWPFHRENYHQWVCHFHRRTMKNYIVMISQGVWGYLCFFLRHNPYPYGFIHPCISACPFLRFSKWYLRAPLRSKLTVAGQKQVERGSSMWGTETPVVTDLQGLSGFTFTRSTQLDSNSETHPFIIFI